MLEIVNKCDFSDDILGYLRQRRGELVPTMRMVGDLTRRVRSRPDSRRLRGQILSNLSILIQGERVIRYRRVTMVAKLPRSSQGYLRISEKFV